MLHLSSAQEELIWLSPVLEYIIHCMQYFNVTDNMGSKAMQFKSQQLCEYTDDIYIYIYYCFVFRHNHYWSNCGSNCGACSGHSGYGACVCMCMCLNAEKNFNKRLAVIKICYLAPMTLWITMQLMSYIFHFTLVSIVTGWHYFPNTDRKSCRFCFISMVFLISYIVYSVNCFV